MLQQALWQLRTWVSVWTLGTLLTSALWASPGDRLEFLESELDNVAGVDGLNGANAVVPSPDGRHLYVSAHGDSSLAVFAVDEVTGATSFQEIHRDGVGGVDGLDGAASAVQSPDGRFVYVAASGDEAISLFRRDSTNGSVQFVEAIYDGVGGVGGLADPTALAVSPDGNNLYSSSFIDNSLAVFSRDPTDGTLSYLEHHRDGIAGVDGLLTPRGVTASPDGRHVYASSHGEHAISIFSRDAATGALSYVGVVRDGVAGVDGLFTAWGLDVSPDGKNLYALGDLANSLVVFDRDPASGLLTYVQRHLDNSGGVTGINQPRRLRVDGSGRFVYVAGCDSSAVALFARDSQSGKLSFLEAQVNGVGGVNGLGCSQAVGLRPDGLSLYGVGLDGMAVFTRPLLSYTEFHQDGVAGVDGLNGANELTLSPDARHLYVAGRFDDAISLFQRDRRSGTLTYLETYANGTGGVSALDGVFSLALSPDGKHLYAAALNDDSLVVFARDAASGVLTQVQVQQHGVDGVVSMQRPAYVRLSPDGQHVYATANQSGAVVAFARDSASGELTFLEAEVPGTDLQGAQELLLSPEGEFLYAAGLTHDTIAIFDRDAATGNLSFVTSVAQPPSLEGTRGLALSPDGLTLYATQINEEIRIYSRDPSTGLLSFEVSRFFAAWSLIADPGGRYVHATSASLDQVITLARRQDGFAVPLEVHEDGFGGVNGLGSARSMALGPNGEHLYVSGQDSDSVAVFRFLRVSPFFADGLESGDVTRWSSSVPSP